MILDIATSLTAPGFVVYLILTWGRGPRAARGTHQRYVYRTLARPLQWVALANQGFGLVSNVYEHTGWAIFTAFCNIFNLIWIWFEIKKFYASDEDDWWKKTGRRLKKWVKRVTQVRIYVPAPVGAR